MHKTAEMDRETLLRQSKTDLYGNKMDENVSEKTARGLRLDMRKDIMREH